MKSGEVILILAGAFLFLSSTFVVFKLCQYLRNKKNKYEIVGNRTIRCPINNELQSSLRTVETQLPVENQPTNNSSHCLSKKERTPTVLILNENYPKERSNSELSDSVFLDESCNFKLRALSQIELRQYERSQEAMKHIRKKDIKVHNSASDCSRSDVPSKKKSEVSLPNSANNCSWSVVPSKLNSKVNLLNYESDKVSTDSLFRDSDKSSISSMGYTECNDEYLSTIRQKLASNRNNKHIQLLKKKKGTITIKAKFQNNTKSLEINIIRIIINEKIRNSNLNYLVCLSIMPGKMQTKTSKYVKDLNGLNFNEHFFFHNLDLTQLHLYSLKITLISCNMIKRKKIVAESLRHLTDLKHAGETPNISFDLFCRFKSKASMASLHISLCHQATISKLDVIIGEAKQLPKFSNIYVTVSLFREEEIEIKNTSTKYNTSDPLFNQSIEFDIRTDGSNPLSVFALVVTVNDLNFLGKNRVIGHVIFSLHSPQKHAATHWNRVQTLPHQTLSEWHSLIDPNEI